MIYLRYPFCDEISGWIDGSAIMKEPITNYYSEIDTHANTTYTEKYKINGLMYFPHTRCYNENMDVEARRKKAMEGLKREV